MKEKILTIELSHENPFGNGYFYATLELPAAEHEIRDAMQQVRMIGQNDTFRSISILDCNVWPDLPYYRLDSPTIDELNFFAKRLAQMDDSEQAIFRTVVAKVLGNPADEILSMKDLINCTYGYDEVMVASNIRTDEQLGQFITETVVRPTAPYTRYERKMYVGHLSLPSTNSEQAEIASSFR